MSNETLFLNIKARIELLITEREGMIAENQLRESLGQSVAYPEHKFTEVATGLESIVQETQSLINFGV